MLRRLGAAPSAPQIFDTAMPTPFVDNRPSGTGRGQGMYAEMLGRGNAERGCSPLWRSALRCRKNGVSFPQGVSSSRCADTDACANLAKMPLGAYHKI